MDELHAAALDGVVRKLKADAGVKTLAGGVYGPGDTPPPGTLPIVLVTPGKTYGPPPGPRQLAQVDARVECRAADPTALGRLLTAAVTALNGAAGAGFRQAVLSDTGPVRDEDGCVARTDVYGLHVKAPAA